jgi:hypothetical protein
MKLGPTQNEASVLQEGHLPPRIMARLVLKSPKRPPTQTPSLPSQIPRTSTLAHIAIHLTPRVYRPRPQITTRSSAVKLEKSAQPLPRLRLSVTISAVDTLLPRNQRHTRLLTPDPSSKGTGRSPTGEQTQTAFTNTTWPGCAATSS